ncbi:hypothetical protein D7030_10265 [Flavobacteriaceae bacterium AU392]|nr:hypothetical protein D1817_06545 [Flavobacteriaceae bacterium]RKM83671.1 hypothetical protein D7030_10265 [Flavobacteriaceae bacterium AU392]
MFKQRKNKRFNYTPRYSDNDRIDANVTSKKDEFASKWQRARNTNTPRSGARISMKFLILILVLLLICMYILDVKFR